MNLDDLLNDFETFHSDLQIDYFIIDKNGGATDYGKYLQVLREVSSRATGIRDKALELEKIQVEIEQLKHKAETLEDVFEKKLNDIEIRKKEGQMKDMLAIYKDTERELLRFSQHAFELKARIGDLNPEKRAILDKEMWLEKIKEYAALDFISTNRLSRETIEIIRSLPIDMKNEMLASIKKPDELLAWFESDKRTLPAVEAPMLTANNRTLK